MMKRIIIKDGKKLCSKCKIWKDFSCYGSRPEGNHLRSKCRDCSKMCHKIWRDTPEQKQKTVERHKRYYDANRKEIISKVTSKLFLKEFGISIEDKEKMFISQGSKCACCGSAEAGHKTGWRMDHNHMTGKNRAVICHPCNATLGQAKENIDRLKSCIEYLIKFNGVGNGR